MAQDIRDMFRQEDTNPKDKLEKGHEKRFEAKLNRELPLQKNSINYFFLKIAAVLVVAIGVAFFLINNPTGGGIENEIVDSPSNEEYQEEVIQGKQFQLSDISPEFKKIETYYLAGINMELARLEINNDNKALIDAFMLELEELDQEYQRLNAELNESGPNEETVEAMIANLQLRMDLLRKLKNKLNELKQNKTKNYDNLHA